MTELVFATNNKHKLQEIRDIAGSKFRIFSLADVGLSGEIPEDAPTLEGNALKKARHVYERFKCHCFADDTGLEIEALDGLPGVKSARYAGEDCIAENNIRKVLEELRDKENRRARFRTVIALIFSGREYIFDGIVNGTILKEKHGSGGFGYDPIFRPDGFGQSFGEMSAELKNTISHRAKAMEKLMDFLRHSLPLH